LINRISLVFFHPIFINLFLVLVYVWFDDRRLLSRRWRSRFLRVNFESDRSFISIALPARTSFAIRLAGDIPEGFAWRAVETVLVLAAEDTDVVLRATE
jgi:hypothetical protein